jgi:uncharacterized protein YecT (DUF1311 family)
MSRLKTIVQTGLGVSLAGFLATSTLADDKPDCIDPQTQMEMTFCAGVDYQEADAALNALWPDVLAAARLNDEYVGDMARERGVPTTVEALRDAQRAWIRFRDACPPPKISRAAYADMFGPTTGDKVRLADTELFIEVEKDFTTYGEEVKFGGGKVIRDGMGQSQAPAPQARSIP